MKSGLVPFLHFAILLCGLLLAALPRLPEAPDDTSYLPLVVRQARKKQAPS